MRRVEIEPQDVIGAINSLDIHNRVRCNWLAEWLQEDEMCTWATESLNRRDERGDADAITWAKRAVCARIDRFINLCLFSQIASQNYPTRIDLLRNVGFEIPNVVYEFIIEPRNVLEHLYRLPPNHHSAARNAVEIARLCLSATRTYIEGNLTQRSCGCIALNWNVLHSQTNKALTFQGFANHPMIFTDVFVESIEVKIVDPVDDEIRHTLLSDFDERTTIELCNLLNRWPENTRSRSETMHSPEFFESAKRNLDF